MKVKKLSGVIKPYDWGKTDFLPSLLGIPADGTCKAEYWMGSHPSGDATLEDGTPLSTYLALHPEACFGSEHIKRFGPFLPFLFKVLAIQKPLSIQCHPTTEQARRGWAKEASLRASDPDHTHWDYQDANQKAEVLYALTPVTAMCGFRPFEEIVAELSPLMPRSFATRFKNLPSGDAGLRELFTTLYTMDKKELSSLIGEYVEGLKRSSLPFATADGRFLDAKGIVLSCLESYPVDPGLFCPFLLHVVHLEPGEALFLKPDTLHAYVLGDGMELMSASDNVLRGGLTHKKVDVPELLSILEIQGGTVEPCKEVDDGGRVRVVTPTPEFALYVIGTGFHRVDTHAIELMLVTEGKAVFESASGTEVFHKGECYLIPQGIGPYTITVEGQVFSASTGV